MSLLIIGCGNRDRGDDAAGVLVAERLRQMGIKTQILSGEATGLLEAWRDADDVIVVDAVMTGAPSGTVQVWDSQLALSFPSSTVSTHGIGVAEAIKLARALERLPGRLRVYGIEGRQFGFGASPSPQVEQAVEDVAQRLVTASS